MDINYFKEFAVLAETRNFWEASDRLFLNQSTLSKHIKAMEQELGVSLFTRTTRKVELTEFGHALLPYAQSITKLQFDYSAMLLQKKKQHKTLITIGSIPTMAQYNITNILLEYQRVCPDCYFKIIEEDSNNLKKLLQERKCELIFLRETKRILEEEFLHEELLVRIPYASDYLVAVLPANHPLAGRTELTLRDLKEEHFCFLKENTMIHGLCRIACQEAGFIPNIVFDSHSLESILNMVATGGCVALLMNNHVEYPLHSRPSIQSPFTAVKLVPPVTTKVSLCYLRNTPLSAAAEDFVNFFKETVPLPEL